MGSFWSSIRDKFASPEYENDEDYLTLDADSESRDSKISVRPFVLNDYEDIKEILNVLREGSTIILLNISPLKEKDIVELKRAINKLKKTTDAVNGEVAGFGDDYIIATPAIASIYRGGRDSSVYD